MITPLQKSPPADNLPAKNRPPGGCPGKADFCQ